MSATPNIGSSGNRGVKEQFQSLVYLLKHSVAVVGDNKEILRPWLLMVVYAFVLACMFYGAVTFILFLHPITIAMGVGLLGLSFLLWLYKFFFFSYQKTRLSWMVHEMLCGDVRSFSEARERTSQLKSQVRKVALIDALKTYISSRKGSGGGGIMGMIVNLLISGLAAVMDLAKHYMLPAVAIDGLHVKETVEQMKSLKDRVPETLMGMFGIDILGHIVIKLIAPVYMLLVLAGMGMAWVMGGFLPDFMVVEMSGPDGDTLALSWVPLVAAMFFGKTVSIFLAQIAACLKVSYFTTFYTEITHRDKLTPKLREELEGFLNLDEDTQLTELLPSR